MRVLNYIFKYNTAGIFASQSSKPFSVCYGTLYEKKSITDNKIDKLKDQSCKVKSENKVNETKGKLGEVKSIPDNKVEELKEKSCQVFQPPKIYEQHFSDIYPEKIVYRKKYHEPIERALGIIKDDFIELYGKVKNFPQKIFRPEECKNKKFDNFNQQIFPEHCDVVIVGGGLAGVSCAYHIQEAIKTALRVVVIEKDMLYSSASSKLSMGGIRQQFSLPENIILSRYGMDFLQSAHHNLAVEGQITPKLDLNLHGYLTLANEEQMETLFENKSILNDFNCHTEIITKEEIKQRYPWMNVQDIEAGIIGTQREGWFDPYNLLVALAQKTSTLGTHFVEASVVGTTTYLSPDKFGGHHGVQDDVRRTMSIDVELPSGEKRNITAPCYIIAAGAWSQEIGRHFGLGSDDGLLSSDLPVEPRKRHVFCIKTPNGPGLNCPMVVDTDGVYFRREGLDDMYYCSHSPSPEDEPPPNNLTVDHSYFTQFIEPSIINRCPSMKDFELIDSWAGYYDYNTFDQNAIIGRHPRFSNVFICTGFSGHGAQHALGAGKVMADILIDIQNSMMNMERLNYDRILVNEPLVERCNY